MNILLAGALGEVGRAVWSALASLGHDVVPVSSRAPLPHEPEILGLDEARSLILDGRIDGVVHAGGPGDHRSGRTGYFDLTIQLRDLSSGLPAVLISTARVLESSSGDVHESSRPVCRTEYARANAMLEDIWLMADSASVLRLTNFFALPKDPYSPQTRLLPWSLLLEGWSRRLIVVRSEESLAKEFVGPRDVAQAIEISISARSPERVALTSPSLSLTMLQLAEIAVCAAGKPEVAVTFEGEPGETLRGVNGGWLQSQGWECHLSAEDMIRGMRLWLIEWSSRITLEHAEKGN